LEYARKHFSHLLTDSLFAYLFDKNQTNKLNNTTAEKFKYRMHSNDGMPKGMPRLTTASADMLPELQ
jgi:hypothetical protein